jgi:hypothetical protein
MYATPGSYFVYASIGSGPSANIGLITGYWGGSFNTAPGAAPLSVTADTPDVDFNAYLQFSVEFEPNDAAAPPFADANAFGLIAAGAYQPALAGLMSSSGVDVFAFNSGSAATIDFLSGWSTAGNFIDLAIVDVAGATLATSTSTNLMNEELVGWTPPAPATGYYLVVSGPSGSSPDENYFVAFQGN